jgi:DNA (cytosine-5)-methyltransferase 1
VTYYNEFDSRAAAWLRELQKEGIIANGTVDERSIHDVRPGDIPERAHFFAGIGGWDLALQLAGWPADWPVWTGSCPCQPFSAAGKRKGVEDDRHLWPEFRRLIAECRPPVVFGEQVALVDGRVWLAGVRSDLEALGYAVGAADLCSAGVGAPNIRQRLYWVAIAQGCGYQQRILGREATTECTALGGRAERLQGGGRDDTPHGGATGRLGGADSERLQAGAATTERASWSMSGGTGGLGYWDAFDVLPCLDGKARRIEPGSFPLAHGVPGRVGLLRGYGNAIVPQAAAAFIEAYREVSA